MEKRFFRLTKLFAKFTTGQALLQLLQAANGLIFVWFLSIQDFAVYAVFTGALGLCSQLAGFGIAPVVVSLVGMGMRDRDMVGRYLAAGFRLRWIALAYVLPFGVGFLWFTAGKAEISTKLFIVYTLCLAACSYLALHADLYALPLKMVDRLGTFYRILIHSELVRLLLAGAFWYSKSLTALSAIVISTAGLLYVFLAFKSASAGHILFPAKRPRREEAELLKVLLPRLPNVIFGGFQGQITIIISAIFGGVSQIASIGALSRLSRLLGFITEANQMLVGPAIARMSELSFWRRLPWMLCLGFLIGSALACTGFLNPELLLMVLGGNYSDLGSVVWIVTLGAGLTTFFGLLQTVVTYKRWVAWWASFGTIGMVVLFQIIVVLNFDVRTTAGVLLLGLAAVLARIVSILSLIVAAKLRPSWLINT